MSVCSDLFRGDSFGSGEFRELVLDAVERFAAERKEPLKRGNKDEEDPVNLAPFFLNLNQDISVSNRR